jgi:hypothetical protein
MKDSPRKTVPARATQPRVERAKRGLVAGYLHSLSDRHAPVERSKDDRRRAA